MNATLPASESARAQFIAGARAQLPILLGVAPFGLIFGALARSAGIPPFETLGFSLFVFAGSAQFIAVLLIAEGAPSFVVVLTIAVVNLRHMLYSASISTHTKHLSRIWKAMLAWLLTDEAYAVASTHYREQSGPQAHCFMFGTGLTLWVTWQLSTAAGILLGAGIPQSWSLDFALPLTFMALIVPVLTDRPTWLAACVAGSSAVLLGALPFRLGFLIAVVLGVLAGWAVERGHGLATGQPT